MQSKDRSRHRPHPVGPTDRGRRLALGGIRTRVARSHSKFRKRPHGPPQRSQQRVRWHNQIEELFQIMSLGDRDAEFFHDCLEKLLRSLLAEETDLVMQWVRFVGEPFGRAAIGFCFSNPFPSRLFHKGRFPS